MPMFQEPHVMLQPRPWAVDDLGAVTTGCPIRIAIVLCDDAGADIILFYSLRLIQMSKCNWHKSHLPAFLALLFKTLNVDLRIVY